MDPAQVLELQKRAVDGEEAAREELIVRHRHFIVWAAGQACHRPVDPQHDDEWSIALSAFNEAIDSYRGERGASFLSHARQVIFRRLVDHFRRQGRESWVSLDAAANGADKAGEATWAEEQASREQYRRDREIEERAEEIGRYEKQLEDFGLTLDDLERICPTHRDTRHELLRIASALASDAELLDSLMTRRQVPVGRLRRKTGASQKLLETWRLYVIAVTLILSGDYDHLREFVQPAPRQGGR